MEAEFKTCPHCGTEGILIMADGRCPHCKKLLLEDKEQLIDSQNALWGKKKSNLQSSLNEIDGPVSQDIPQPRLEEVSVYASKQINETKINENSGCADPGERQPIRSRSHARRLWIAAFVAVIMLCCMYLAWHWFLSSPLPDDLVRVGIADYSSLVLLAPGSEQAQVRQRQAVHEYHLPLEVHTRKTNIVFRLIPAGSFTMGSPPDETRRESSKIQQQVTLTKPFYCGKFEVTQGQWDQVMGSSPSKQKDDNKYDPVEGVTWEECQAFLSKLCQVEGVPEGTYRFLTEAEWEYACRAGTQSTFCWGDDLTVSISVGRGKTCLIPMANFGYSMERRELVALFGKQGEQTNFLIDLLCRQLDMSRGQAALMVSFLIGGEGRPMPPESCLFRPNAWGLHDMHGNVAEWCQDWYGEYIRGMLVDPSGPSSGDRRVIRGGSCQGDWGSADRGSFPPSDRSGGVGLRIARTVSFSS